MYQSNIKPIHEWIFSSKVNIVCGGLPQTSMLQGWTWCLGLMKGQYHWTHIVKWISILITLGQNAFCHFSNLCASSTICGDTWNRYLDVLQVFTDPCSNWKYLNPGESTRYFINSKLCWKTLQNWLSLGLSPKICRRFKIKNSRDTMLKVQVAEILSIFASGIFMYSSRGLSHCCNFRKSQS